MAVLTSDIVPTYFLNSEEDTMPPHQMAVIECALESAGVNPALYKAWTIPNSREHAFQYWHSPIYDTNPADNTLVKDRIIAFFDQ